MPLATAIMNEYDKMLSNEQSSAPKPQSNEYDDLISSEQKFRKSNIKAVSFIINRSDPKIRARANELSDITGIPVEVVERNIEQVEQKVKKERINLPSDFEVEMQKPPKDLSIRAYIPGEKIRDLTPEGERALSDSLESQYLKEHAPFEMQMQAFTTGLVRTSPPGLLFRAIAGDETIPEDKSLSKAFPVHDFTGKMVGNISTIASGMGIANPYLVNLIPSMIKSVPMFTELYPTASRVLGGIIKDAIMGAGIGAGREVLEQTAERKFDIGKIGVESIATGAAFAPFGVVPYTKIGIEGGLSGAVKRGSTAAGLVGSVTTVIDLIRSGKIGESELLNISINSIAAGLMQGMNARQISESFKNAEVRDFFYRKSFNKVKQTSPNLTDQEAKAVAIVLTEGIGKTPPAIIEKVEKAVNPTKQEIAKIEQESGVRLVREFPEVSAETPESIITRSGGEFVGIQESEGGKLVLFNEPTTKSTASLPLGEVSKDAVIAKLEEVKQRFKATEMPQGTPQEPIVEEKGGKGAEMPQKVEKPIGIVSFVKRNGRINPGKLESSDILEIDRKDLINRKDGKSLDHMTESAIEAGYLPSGSTGSDLIQLIDNEIKGGKKKLPVGEVEEKTAGKERREWEETHPTEVSIGDLNLKKGDKIDFVHNGETHTGKVSEVKENGSVKIANDVTLKMDVFDTLDVVRVRSKSAQEQKIIPGMPEAQMPGKPMEAKAGQVEPQNLMEGFKPEVEQPKLFKTGTSGQAAFSAPMSEAAEVTEQGEPESVKNLVYPNAPNDFQPHIEMPELVKLAKELMGNAPVVGGLRKNLGLFISSGADAKIKLAPSIFRDVVESTKILAHEIGHLIDWLPNNILSRGNILGRLKTLVEFRKTVIEALPSADDEISVLDRKIMRDQATSQALKEGGYKLGQYIKDKTIRSELAPKIKELYQKKVDEEIKSKGLITKEQVINELKEVTKYWHPFDDTVPGTYRNTRYSSRELYAEALSMLLNQPEKLQELAPTFYKTFWDNIERKPEVKQALMELDDLLSKGEPELLQKRQNDIRNMFRNGEELFKEKRQERTLKKNRLWFRIKDELIDKNEALIEKVKDSRKTGRLNPEDDPIYFLESHNYIGGKIHNMATNFDEKVTMPCINQGITAEDLGEYLMLRRILNERKNIANPLGHNLMTAQKQLDFLLSKFTPEQKGILDNSVSEFDIMIKSLTEEMGSLGMINPETLEAITVDPNSTYASFQVLDYLSDYVSARIIHQVGTFKEIANPLTSSFMKMISMRRAIEREKARKITVNFMQTFHPSEIREAEYSWTGKNREVKESKEFGTIVVHENGSIKGYYVDPFIADSVNFNSSINTNAIIEVIKYLNRGWFRPIYITFNMGFQSFNAIRDFQRSWKLSPNTNLVQHVKNFYRAMPSAASRIWGNNPDKTIREMYEAGMLSVTFNDLSTGATDEDTQIEYILRKHDADTRDWKRFLNPFKLVMDAIEEIGNFIETLPKVSGYLSRKESKLPVQVVAHEVRVYSGSPDFLRKGKGYWWYNEVFLFSNAIKEGYRGDIEGAFKNPRTRSGYWWKTAGATFLPKLLMFLAGIGYFGKKLKDNYSKQTEYDKTNYITIPIGSDDKGQAVYLRVPMDETGRFLGGVFWKMIRHKGDVLKSAQDVFSLMAGQIPSQAPIIDMLSVITQYVTGQNPYDFFRGRNILTDDEQKIRGFYGARKMGRWFLNKSGIPFVANWGYQGKPGEPWIVKSARIAPVLSRFIKITDYGLKEQAREIKSKKIENSALIRLKKFDALHSLR